MEMLQQLHEIDERGQKWIQSELLLPISDKDKEYWKITNENISYPSAASVHFQILTSFVDKLLQTNLQCMPREHFDSGTKCVLKHMFHRARIANKYKKFLNLLNFANYNIHCDKLLETNIREMFNMKWSENSILLY